MKGWLAGSRRAILDKACAFPPKQEVKEEIKNTQSIVPPGVSSAVNSHIKGWLAGSRKVLAAKNEKNSAVPASSGVEVKIPTIEYTKSSTLDLSPAEASSLLLSGVPRSASAPFGEDLSGWKTRRTTAVNYHWGLIRGDVKGERIRRSNTIDTDKRQEGSGILQDASERVAGWKTTRASAVNQHWGLVRCVLLNNTCRGEVKGERHLRLRSKSVSNSSQFSIGSDTCSPRFQRAERRLPASKVFTERDAANVSSFISIRQSQTCMQEDESKREIGKVLKGIE
jgi:hypothetical protein